RHSDHRFARLHVVCDHGAGPDERVLADADAPEDDRARPEPRAGLDPRRKQRPVVGRLQSSVVRRRPRKLVVYKDDAVPDEHFVADLDSGADKGVALDLAALADDDSALDLYERPDSRL